MELNKNSKTNNTCPLSGPSYQGRTPVSDGARQQASNAWMCSEWSPTTSGHLEETWSNIGRKQSQVSSSSRTATFVIVLLPSHIFHIAKLSVSLMLWTRVQVHVCRGWVFAHQLRSGDRHRSLPLYGNQSGWNSTQESGSASIWWVANMYHRRHKNAFKWQLIYYCFLSFSASFHRWWSH